MNSWPTASLMEVCEIEGGTQPPKETFRYEPTEGYVRMLQIQDFKSDESAVFIPKGVRMKSCEEDDVLIARYGASIGRILRGKAGAYNVALVKTVPDESRLERDFLYHLLNGHGFQHFILNVGSRAAQAGFNKGDLERFQFVLPPLAEQRRIAEVLDRAEALRAKRRAALAQLDSLTQSLFLDLFGDDGANPKKWPLHSVSDYVREFQGGKSIESESGENVITRNRVLKVSAVTGMKFLAHESKPVPDSYQPPKEHFAKPGDLLFSRANTTELVGAVAYVERTPPNVLLPDKLWRFVWRDPAVIEPLFVWALFQTPTLRREIGRRATGTSGSMKNISQEKVFGIRTIFPPIALQREFARRVMTVQALKRAQRMSLAELDALFATLQHRAFRGEL